MTTPAARVRTLSLIGQFAGATARPTPDRAAPSSRCRIRAVVPFPNATVKSASRARRWNTFWDTVCDSRNRAGASTVVRAITSERTASRPSRNRQPAERHRANP